MDKLKEINLFYQNVNDGMIDDSAKKTIEIVNTTTSKLLEKCSKEVREGLQAYTIRRMDEKLPVGLDCDHYKMMTVQEPDSRQSYLDVLCFPCLQVKLDFSEYVKSKLLNKHSCFRKSPEFVFYNLWLKELRELSSGIYNTLKRSGQGRQEVTAHNFVEGIHLSDHKVEANLQTMFQSVRGSKQFWFLRRSEVLCMIREHGPPSLFLTLSCAEYESSEISVYLHKVNDVPKKYPIGKLCTEDPISVTRKFKQKFK